MTIPDIPDGAALPYYDLAEPRLVNREIKDGGSDIKTVEYPLADHYLQIGVVRRRTYRTLSGEKAPIDEKYAREDVAVRFQLMLGGRDGSDVIHRAKEMAAQPWLDCDLIIDDESVQGCRWRQDDWSVLMHLTPTLIIYAILPDDEMGNPVRLARLII